ncbi:1,4-alpha-glucan branching protein GlgB [Paracraurococcus ruber]|uniref:1,4-alpha-glucan branching enzyme GlgB n=1 Tax=Paracraurococcus ruber TaxID=77675 RepID=A0ABS1D2M6_9PROT|nr:1,4-alpha-glucan branching protein GlgB [Paracraurococcus ruber]MBK1660154.1 1,4-alpha-glucan branching enzyme [Paracraurococcus ruber]TDG32464.1 1,4-alpha-glucan branching protein GlgB [Paracraurococcus ruber]
MNQAFDALAAGRHGDPFSLLGPHGEEVCTFQPGARGVTVLARDGGEELGRLERVHPAGIFAGRVARQVPYRLRVDWPGLPQETEDPYSFGLLLGPLDMHLFAEGRHFELARVFGAQAMTIDGVPGVRFALWAPNAQRASVVGDFNGWDGRRHPMRLRREAGVWELFIPRLQPGATYKYELIGADGGVLPLKADPLAQMTEVPPATASRVMDPAPFAWSDAAWMARRGAAQAPDAPISVYEVHAGSWWRDAEGKSPDWHRLADRLIPYVQGMGFTHVEFMPVMEHPFGGSWGYQPLSMFAPSARFGSPSGFAHFVDRAHAAGIGVILDWVPAHFPTDAHGLYRFDGTALYEHADPREGFHRDWNTAIYNFGRNEVRGFLLASAIHWLEHYHVDGLRVDAVASMLYRDYSRPAGEWIPNRFGGRENLEAVAFIQELNAVVAERCPGAVMIAEESTAWPGVTRPTSQGGLGFHYKWNMGWMHDTLHYIEEDPVHRQFHHDQMTFGLVYAWSERFVLPLSHDEVVYGKGSLYGKMPGDAWQKFANLRAYLAFMWTHPGKKLIFMGGEIAQPAEWNHDASIDWPLLDDARHRGIQRLLHDLNAAYRGLPALHRRDAEPEGWHWVIGDDRAQSVFAWLRLGAEGDPPALVVLNMTPVPRHGYRIGVPRGGTWQEMLNTDGAAYGGSNSGNGGWIQAEAVPAHGCSESLSLFLPPLAALILTPQG